MGPVEAARAVAPAPPASSADATTTGTVRPRIHRATPVRRASTISTITVSKTTETTPSGSAQFPTSSRIFGSPTVRLAT